MYRCATSWGDPGIVSRRKYARGKALRVAKPAFPPRAPPFPGTHFEAYVVECATLLAGRCTPGCRSRQAEPMDEGGRESGPRSGPVPCFLLKSIKINRGL
jgi:hypothetical protein